ncbi:uncharacterized protein LOC110843453 isoform X2 [Folsomia candida]|uniref:uncharacterized protein LOC110843453 isoform X2 n=1 Tax=Folsomia candida TaxID=158441 RepID=UPI00160554CA|nr:uncharacterized protein LOC110843453 isoform X2 [Folsomia candida]
MRNGKYSGLVLFFTLILKARGENSLTMLQRCADAEFERFYNYVNRPVPLDKSVVKRGPELNEFNITHFDNCGNKSFKISELKLTKDNYLNEDDVFYPPDNFCLNSKDNTVKICHLAKLKPIAKKCCPEDEIWDFENQNCRAASNHFRPKISSHLVESESHEEQDRRLPFQIVNGSQNFKSSVIINSTSTAIAIPLSCPPGYDLKIYISDPCASSNMSPSSFLEDLPPVSGNDGNDSFHEMPYEMGCRFQITATGVEYETASGLFHRKSYMNKMEHDNYCVEGYFNNALCYDTRPTDNQILQQKCVQSLNNFLMFCEPSDSLQQSEQSPIKAYFLASIWLSTCPLLLSAAMAKFITSHKNVHGWTLSSYLLSMFLVNINSAILALETRTLGCKVTDFSMKFLYLSTLSWLTCVDFGLWRTFSKIPKPVAPHYFIFNLLFSTMFPAAIVTISYFGAQGKTCGSQYCVLYSHRTIPYYNLPVIFLIFLNLVLFIRTSVTIAGLRQETGSVLYKEPGGRRHLESFRLFSKLILMSGPIWIIRLVLFFLQITGFYFTWYAIIFEAIFSIPEIVFSTMVLLHPEFKKWAWQKHPNISRRLSGLIPWFSYAPVVNIEMGSKSNHSTNTVNAGKSPTTSINP